MTRPANQHGSPSAESSSGRLMVTNAPAGSPAAHAILAHLVSDEPLSVLLPNHMAVPAGVTPLYVQSRGANFLVLRAAVCGLRRGRRLVVLRSPEGKRPLRNRVVQARWGALVRGLARLGRARVVPAYITVPGSPLARFWQRWQPRRTDSGPNAPQVRIGDALPARKLNEFTRDYEAGRYLRLRIGMLGAVAQGRGLARPHAAAPRRSVADGPTSATLAAEIDALANEAHLLDQGPYRVYCAETHAIPNVLREIGRLREVTFRVVGEGTGGDVDLDVFDTYYRHLFIWQYERGEIVGGYRLGLADDILERFGKRGLYSHSLFRFPSQLIERLNPAIELGRSFVRPEYQREYPPLMLLWKGISQFVMRHPRYSVLFGPVSISADYQTTSQQLLVDFLTRNSARRDLARWVFPRRPFRGQRRPIWRRARFAGLDSIEDLSELIGQIESDAKGVPVLLRQYLKLGGKLLGFNVDDQFSDVLDGLIMVDLLDTDRRVLQRYFGREGAAAFEAWHESNETASRAVS